MTTYKPGSIEASGFLLDIASNMVWLKSCPWGLIWDGS